MTSSTSALAIHTAYQAALSALKANRYVDAENGFRKVLSLDSRNANALHMLGLIESRKGNPTRAELFIRQALTIREDPFFLSDLGDILRQLNRLQETEAVYRRAIEIKPDFVQIQYNLALLHHLGKRFPEANAAYRRVLQLQPDHVFTYYNLAKLLRDNGQIDEAEKAYLRAITLNPAHDYAYNNLGNLYKESGRVAEAAFALKHALIFNPGNENALFNLGNLLREHGHSMDARNAYRRAIAVKPNYVDAHNNLGSLFKEAGELVEAEAAYRRALGLNLDSPELESPLRRALNLRRDFPDAQSNLATLLLAQGRYREAWPYHEARYYPGTGTSVPVPNLPFPQWRGELLAGKSLLIFTEQGFGDYIQFARYAPLVKALGVARLTLFCAPSLEALLATVPGVDAVSTNIHSLGSHDYWVFPMSLPLHFDTTLENIPNALPYISAPPDRIQFWKDKLPTQRHRIGLAWKGNPMHENDGMRSLPGLQTLAPLWEIPGVSFISLQKGQGEDEAQHAKESQLILHLGSEITDFADTAAIVSQLDLVICVDTAVAHVAGALGRPCWILLPHTKTDWRWLMQRSDSPWYPNAIRLFRQSQTNQWNATVDEVASEITKWKAARDSNGC